MADGILFFQQEDGIRYLTVTGVQTCALPIWDAQRFALGLGAEWAGTSDAPPPEPLDAAIIFAPAGPLVPAALRAVVKGGTVVCAGIHMSDIPAFPYDVLWGERTLRSVANLTRRDGTEVLALAPRG